MAVNIEQEIKLRVPRRFDLKELSAGVNGYSATPLDAQRLYTVYYDTDDFRLARWDCALRRRKGEGWTLKLPAASVSPTARSEYNFPETTKPPGEALELITAFLRGKSVAPVARLRTLRKSLKLRDANGEETAEIVDDDVRVLDHGRVAKHFREVEIELLNGAPASVLDELKDRLQSLGAGSTDQTPKSLRALPDEAKVPELEPPRLSNQSEATDVIRYALICSVRRLMRCDPLLRADMNPEAVHQARVATRRLRSDLRTFLPLLDHDWACELRDKLRWLADELGAVRDEDVMFERLENKTKALNVQDQPAARTILEQFKKQIATHRQRLHGVLKEQRYVQLLEELVVSANEPKILPDAHELGTTALPKLVEPPWRKLRKTMECLKEASSNEELHCGRIRAKRVRYAAEAIEPVCGKAARKLAKRVEKLQTVLGDLHDAVVAQDRLREVKGDAPVRFVAGELVAMEAAAVEAGRKQWPKVWRKASKKKLVEWI